jgi:hypothetical protein
MHHVIYLDGGSGFCQVFVHIGTRTWEMIIIGLMRGLIARRGRAKWISRVGGGASCC